MCRVLVISTVPLLIRYMNLSPWMLPLVLVCLLALSFLLFRLSNRRQRLWKRLSQQLDLPCQFYGNGELSERMLEYRIGCRGKFPAVTAEVFGQWRDMDIQVFDYHFLKGKGKRLARHSQTLLYIRHPDLRFSPFSLLPRKLSDLPFLSQKEEITLPVRIKLQEHYYISTENGDPASWMLDEEFHSLLEKENYRLCIEGRPQALLIYTQNGVSDYEDILFLLNKGERLFDWFRRLSL